MADSTPIVPIIQVGAVICERHKQGYPRTITSMVRDQYVVTRSNTTGRRTRISWATLKRYDVLR